jgi:hypothetical protein
VAAPQSLLGQARAFARDYPRDRMPAGYLWDVVDYVPLIVDAGLTGRGGWVWGSNVMGGDASAGILASYTSGEKLLVIGSDHQWYEVDQTTMAVTPKGAAYTALQNPVQWVDSVIAFDGAGAAVPQLVTAPAGATTVGTMHASAPKAKVGCIYNAYIVVGDGANVRFSFPNDPLHAWDPFSYIPMDNQVTAMAALRSVILAFHAGSVERIRGGKPDSGEAGNGDMFAERLFDRVGCTEPKSIAYWNDNVVFADEHGVHMSDGAVIRNIASQGGILYYWRTVWGGRVSVAATTFLDYYVITIRRSSGPAITLICDLNKRQWFRFANVYGLSYFASSGSTGMERIWSGMAGSNRLARVSPMFFPTLGAGAIQDADGVTVLPEFETPWYRMGKEGRKRSRFAYLSYDARTPGTTAEPAGWREGVELDPDENGVPPLAPPAVLAAVAPVLDIGYINSPSDLVYTAMGGMPPTTRYTRHKLPVYQGSYGVAFRVRQLTPTSVTRIYDLAVEGQPLEPSHL